jgi:hypothetical protein
VLVLVEYHVKATHRDEFLRAIALYARARRRDGAYDWGVFEDPAQEGRYIETFLTDSWIEHLRLHRRVTNADRVVEQSVRRFQTGGEPKTTHLVAARLED